MQKLEDAQRAAEVLHGQPFMGRELMVSAASERPETPEKAEEKPAETAVETAAAESAAPEAPAAPEEE
ncbi:MAG: RNA-binding protein, partial [Akkermansia sp.]|nr:RNA-binding protein [Akkermansia sp.]